MDKTGNIEKNTDINQPKMLVGTDDFSKLLLESDVYVDKTMLIKAFVENSSETVLIVRPRRWGKSMNLDMIAKFLTLEVDAIGNVLPTEKKHYRKLFIGGEITINKYRSRVITPSKIAAYSDFIEEYQGQYPVIKIGFKQVKGGSYAEIESKIKLQIKELFSLHKYLARSKLLDEEQKAELARYLAGDIDTALIEDSLKFLSKLLATHFSQKAYILIDEYDTPINDAYIQFYKKQKGEFDKVIKLFQGIFSAGLKTNDYLAKGLVTGILRVAKANIFSGINNLAEDCILDKKFAPYYGFTQCEVEELLAKTPIKTNPESIKKWYNGYHMGGQTIYNPWSIMQCLSHEGAYDTYWVDSGGTQILDTVLLSDRIQEELQMLLEDKPLVKRVVKHIAFDEFEDNLSIFYSLLLFAGYLNAKPESDDEDEQCQTQRYFLTIPNAELKNIYIDRVSKWVVRKLSLPGEDYDSFIDPLINKNLDQFFQNLAKYLMNSTSFHDLVSERDYHNLMGGILTPLVTRYHVQSNQEAGLGRFDHNLIPRREKYDTAFIFEYKLSKNKELMESDSAKALAQINDNHYDSHIKNSPHVKFITKIGMAFCGKEFRTKITTEVNQSSSE